MQSSSRFLEALYPSFEYVFSFSIVCSRKADWYIVCKQCRMQISTDSHVLEKSFGLNSKDTIKHAECW